MKSSTCRFSEFRDVSLRGTYASQERDLRINANYYHQFITREAKPLTEDPFSILLGNYEPYYQGGLNVYKGLGKRLGLEGGVFYRELVDSNDEALYNHSYRRYLVSLYLYKTPFESSEFVFGADWWFASDESETQGWNGEYSQKLGKRLKFKAGTAYYLYKIDSLTGEEDEELQEYYVGLSADVGKHFILRTDYSFESGTLREMDTLRVRLKYEF